MADFTYTLVGQLKGDLFTIAQDVDFQEAVEMSIDHNHLYDTIHIKQEHEIITRSENILIVSDTQGMLKETKLLIEERPKDLKEQIVFLGNFISKDESFIDYMSYLVDLISRKDCVFVLGKNEYNLLECMNGTHNYIGLLDDVSALIESVEASCGCALVDLKTVMPDVYRILNTAVKYYETDAYIFTSGGLDLGTDSWRQSPPEALHQTTPDFIVDANNTAKTIVFGSTPVRHINSDEQNRPWINRSQKKIGINGDISNYGKLIALLVHDTDRCFISIRHQKTRNVAEAYIGSDHLLLGYSTAKL